MAYVINNRLRGYLNFESVKNFLRSVGLPPSGVKSELLSRVEASINNGVLKVKDWENFLVDELKYGHNRSIYRTKLNSASLSKLKTYERLSEALSKANLPTEPFSNLHQAFPNSEEPELVQFDVIAENNIVLKIEMCFAYLVWTNKVLDEQEVIQVDETDYVWIEIDVKSELLTISLRPRSNIGESSGRTFQLFESYTAFLTDLFSVRYLTNDDFKSVLYNIFRELTSQAETPYVEKVAPLVEEIQQISKKYADFLELPSSEEPVNLPFRFKRLLERALIQNDFFNFKSYSEGKQGIIEKFFYADETGARVNASANEGDGIELSDIYFDTRETIDDQRTFNKLWVTWFMPEGSLYKQTDVRLEANSKYYLIHFFKYLSRGEKEHVLSTIETFRELRN